LPISNKNGKYAAGKLIVYKTGSIAESVGHFGKKAGKN